jgi:hypothetical protein
VPDGRLVGFAEQGDRTIGIAAAGRAFGRDRERGRKHLELRGVPRAREQILDVVVVLAAAELDIAGPDVDRDPERLVQPGVAGQRFGTGQCFIPPAQLVEQLERRDLRPRSLAERAAAVGERGRLVEQLDRRLRPL